MRLETRQCLCGAARGRYLADRATVEQTVGSLSLALNNHDFSLAQEIFNEAAHQWSPFFVLRAYLNPTCENDVRWVPDVPDGAAAALPEATPSDPAPDAQ
jgi:hypothetical protein